MPSRASNNVVVAIAGCGDRALTQDSRCMVMQPPVQLRAPVDCGGELGSRDLKEQPARLAYDPGSADGVSDHSRPPGHPFAADEANLDGGSVGQQHELG
jgi:hypothetical protein